MKTCSVDGCEKPVKGRGWCAAHYQRWCRKGDHLARCRSKAENGEPDRYFNEVVMAYDGDECLFWPFARSTKGYAHLHGKNASRKLCSEKCGPPPTPKHDAAHSCGKGSSGCVTKRHLSWKTHAENEADKLDHGTHSRGSRNPNAKLTEPEVVKARSLYGKIPTNELAALVGVSASYVRKLGRRKVWAWLEETAQ